MTSARDTVSSAGDPFAQGAGFVNPNGAADPGLVYPTTATEYRQYLVSLGVQFAPPNDTLTPITGLEPQPGVDRDRQARRHGVGDAPGEERRARPPRPTTRARRVAGFTVTVVPSSITLAPGAEATFTVTFARDTAPLSAWAIGSLTWTDGTHNVRSPIALQPVAVSAPTEVHGAASASGSQDFQVTPGFTGPLDTSVSGLVGVTPTADSVVSGAFDITAPVADADTKHYTVIVPAGTRAARFSLDSDDNTADLDLFVYQGGQLVDLSAIGSADEQVTLLAPAAGTYDVYVNGFATPGGTTTYHLANFVVAATDAGNASVSPDPAAATAGVPITLTFNWTGLDTSKRYFGVISYAGADDVTFASVN